MGYKYRYKLKINNSTEYILDSLINSSNTSIKTPLSSTELKSASGALTFSLIGARNTNYYSQIIQAILSARENSSVYDTLITVEKIDDSDNSSTFIFRGYLDNSNFSVTSKIIPENVTLTARDKTVLLDEKIRFNRIYEGKTRKYILEKLLEDLTIDTGITATLLSYPSYLNDSTTESQYVVSNWCVAEENNDTYRTRIDTLLYEAPACVLYYDHANDGYRVVQLPDCVISNYSNTSTYKIGDICKRNNVLYRCITAIPTAHSWRSSEWETVRAVNYLARTSSLQTSAGVYKYDGLLLKYPTVAEKSNQNLYAENITTGLDSETGQITGLEVPAAHYFPTDGDVTATYQKYSSQGLDRAYITKESRLKNEDISLLYAKNCSYAISQHPNNAIVLETNALPNIGWTGSAQYFPLKSWVLMKNTTANTATVSGFSIQGTAVYVSKMNKLTVPNICSNPEEYETETIFENTTNSDSHAKAFAQWLYNAKKYSSSTSTWEETDVREAPLSNLGEVVNVIHKDTGIAIPHVVVQIDDVTLGGNSCLRKRKITAVSISGYSAYVSVKQTDLPSVGVPTNASKVLITTKEFALSVSGSVAPTIGWVSSRSQLTPTSATPYVWTRETMTYGDGTVSTGGAYVTEVYTETEVVEYSMSVSPYTIIKDLRKSNSQYLNIVANISGYDSPVINYKFNNEFIGSRYKRTTDVIPQSGKTYYSFTQTTDQTAQTGKTYYLNRSSYYEECVNMSSFVLPYTYYYERSTVIYSRTAYELDIDLHTTNVTLEIPYINDFGSSVSIILFNGTTAMDSVTVNVTDQTEYTKCINVLDSTATGFPTETTSGESLVEGDFVVFSQNCNFGNVLHTAGSVWYLNLSNVWTETVIKEKTSEKLVALQQLIERGVNLKDLNETSVIQWFSEIVATSITAEYIGAKEIQIQTGGSIRGGDYQADGTIPSGTVDPTGFYIGSDGRIVASNANFSRIQIDKESVVKGTLQCGNDNDVLLSTNFADSSQSRAYVANRSESHNDVPDGFIWSEVYTKLNSQIGTPSTSLWNSDADSNTLCPIVKKTATGTVNGYIVDNLIYTTNPVINCSTSSTRYTNGSSATANRTTRLHNPLPVNMNLNYYFQRGIAKWKVAWNKGTRLTNCSYVITHADSTTTSVTIFSYASSGAESASGTITLLPGDTIVWTYGYIEAPSSSWNNGYASSVLNLSWVLELEDGFNFYTNGTRHLMPKTGMCDLTTTTGMSNLTWNGSAILNLPRTTASWPVNINKCYKFVHTFNGSSTITPNTYSVFSACTSIYIRDTNGVLHGTSSPNIALLALISIATGEVSFTYNGSSYSQTLNGWTRGYNIQLTVPSVLKGIYTGCVYPRLAQNGNPVATPVEELGSGVNPYKAVHAQTGDFTSVIASGNMSATGSITSASIDSKATIIEKTTETPSSEAGTARLCSLGASVVETWRNGTEWYRIWSDGWVEQGGTFTNSSRTKAITYKIPMADTNYNVQVTLTHGESGWSATVNTAVLKNSKSTTGFTSLTWFNQSLTTGTNDWRVDGYADPTAI